MCKVYNLYDNKLVGTFPSKEEAERWIGQRACDWNYGIFGEWTYDGKHCYDVGSRVFYIKEN